jgi:DinB superfamily
MSELVAARDANRKSVAEFVTVARGVDAGAWNREPAPGKWSPAQVTEHVTLAYAQTRDLLKTPPAGGAPWFLRPLIRRFYVRPILKTGKFPANARAPRQFRPSASMEPADALLSRLQSAADGLERDLEELAGRGTTAINHPIFGRTPLTDALHFQAIHTAHHRRQLLPRQP